jgi:hypothetical protein
VNLKITVGGGGENDNVLSTTGAMPRSAAIASKYADAMLANEWKENLCTVFPEISTIHLGIHEILGAASSGTYVKRGMMSAPFYDQYDFFTAGWPRNMRPHSRGNTEAIIAK